jgi:hypothetical protein
MTKTDGNSHVLSDWNNVLVMKRCWDITNNNNAIATFQQTHNLSGSTNRRKKKKKNIQG